MGTAERRQKEKKDREALFLDKAAELIRTDGLLNLQMARLAEACEYATGTLYQHFSSKEDLLVALAEQGAGEHINIFRQAAAWDAGTRNRMFAIAVGDVFFTQQNPEHAKLMQYIFAEAVWENASPSRREKLLGQCEPINQIINQLVSDACRNGDLNPNGLRPMELALGPWCLCEGMHSLVHTQGLLETCQVERPEALLYLHVQILLNGMGWKPLLDPIEPEAITDLVQTIRNDLFDA